MQIPARWESCTGGKSWTWNSSLQIRPWHPMTHVSSGCYPENHQFFSRAQTAQHRDNPYMENPLVVVSHEGLALSLSGFKWAKRGGSGDVGMLPLLQSSWLSTSLCVWKVAIVCLCLFTCNNAWPQIDDNSASIQVSLQLADSMCVPQWMVSTSDVRKGPLLRWTLRRFVRPSCCLWLWTFYGLTVDSWHILRVIRCDKIDKEILAIQTGAMWMIQKPLRSYKCCLLQVKIRKTWITSAVAHECSKSNAIINLSHWITM